MVAEAEAALEASEAQARQERIELFGRQMARRLLNQQLASGFAAWVEMYTATMYARERMRTVANQMRAPALQRAFAGEELATLGASPAGRVALAQGLRLCDGSLSDDDDAGWDATYW